MGLVQDLLEDSWHPGPKCRLAPYLDQLPDTDRDELIAAIGEPRITAEAIARHLKRHGQHIQAGTIQRHRRNECATCTTAGRVYGTH